MVVHVRYKSLYISLPSSAKQQREMNKSCVVYWTRTATTKFSYFHLELNVLIVIQPGHVFRTIGVLNSSRQLRILLPVKYKFTLTGRRPLRRRCRCLSSKCRQLITKIFISPLSDVQDPVLSFNSSVAANYNSTNCECIAMFPGIKFFEVVDKV